MPLTLTDHRPTAWQVRKIGVIGPGIVGMPMAAMLAHARIREGGDAPARVLVMQRASPTSGWKVEAINQGRSPIGGVEPALDEIVRESVAQGLLGATHDIDDLHDADVVLVCVQTDRDGLAPAYGPLLEALTGLARAFQRRPAGNVPLVIIESTLAPSSMASVVRELFAAQGLVEGRDILLGNSPNRVMPGRLVERVKGSDKIVAGLHPATPDMIGRLYREIVTGGTLLPANSLTAEVVKTLENAYRDVRIAFAAEVCRWCDELDIDFHAVREQVNRRVAQTDSASGNPLAVPSGALLVPTVGVGGHCLPKDGILLWWRALEAGEDTARSLILEARRINDESPAETRCLLERLAGPVDGRRIALLGTAYRFDSEDTRNSPTLALAGLLRQEGADVVLHDPYVAPHDQNLRRFELDGLFTRDLHQALEGADAAVLCTAHHDYLEAREEIVHRGPRVVLDGCNLYRRQEIPAGTHYGGIGRGRQAPPATLVDWTERAFRAVETGVANEVEALCRFLDQRYGADGFGRLRFADVQRIAATCVTGCLLAEPGPVAAPPPWQGRQSRLVRRAAT